MTTHLPVLLVANNYGPHRDDNTVQRFDITAGDLIRLDPAMLVNGPTDVALTNRFHTFAVNDMVQQAAQNSDFGAPHYGGFGQGFKHEVFSITQMPFDFGRGYHADGACALARRLYSAIYYVLRYGHPAMDGVDTG